MISINDLHDHGAAHDAISARLARGADLLSLVSNPGHIVDFPDLPDPAELGSLSSYLSKFES